MIPDHLHGRISGYREGCRCAPCALAWNRKNKAWLARAYQNGGRTTVPVEDVLPILQDLTTRMSQNAIGQLVGVSGSYIGRLLRQDIKTVGLDRAQAIKSINPDQRPTGGTFISSLGATRRLRALSALGYSAYRLQAELNYPRSLIFNLLTGETPAIHAHTHRKIAEHYDRLSMSLPTPRNQNDASGITRARNRAEREGWAPPLAWTNPDDPDENPGDWRYRTADRADQLADLDHMQAGISEACTRLDVSRDSLEKWCERHGHRDIYTRMVAREHVGRGFTGNQHREAS